MKKIITLAGSSSKKSINKQLAEYTASLMQDVDILNLDLNNYALPLYSIDVENDEGFPADLLELDEIIERTDGIIVSLAEHNGAYSAAFKNAFDWLSRINGKVWKNKPMLLLSTSPGARGGQSVMELALSRFPYGGGNIIGSITFPSFYDNFKDGKVENIDLNNKLVALTKDLIKTL